MNKEEMEVEIDNIDDFLPMPGADSVVTATEDDKPAGNVFTKNEVDLDFLNKEKEVATDNNEDNNVKDEEVLEILEDLDKDIKNEDDDTTSKVGRRKVDKSGLVETFTSLIKDGLIIPFEDDKPLEEYTSKDFKELIQTNIEERERVIREQTPQAFFDSLPEEMQYAAEYIAKGGKDMKGLFSALAQMQDVRALDPNEPDHQEIIARQYLQATGYGNGDSEIIEDQIQEWFDTGLMSKKANQFKPKLDEMEDDVMKAKLAQQEMFKQQQIAKKDAYMQNIYNTLKPAELNGIKLDAKRQKFLWDELTTVKYESLSGRPTNLFGKLIEEKQFGEKTDYPLIAEALWLLSDPDDYKENIRKVERTIVTQEVVRKLKSEEGRKLSNTTLEEKEEKRPSSSPGLKRKPANIFQSNR